MKAAVSDLLLDVPTLYLKMLLYVIAHLFRDVIALLSIPRLLSSRHRHATEPEATLLYSLCRTRTHCSSFECRGSLGIVA